MKLINKHNQMQDPCYNYDDMSLKEIEMMQRLLDLKRRYLQKQNELKKLQRRKKTFENLRKKKKKLKNSAFNDTTPKPELNAIIDDNNNVTKPTKLQNGECSHDDIVENTNLIDLKTNSKNNIINIKTEINCKNENKINEILPVNNEKLLENTNLSSNIVTEDKQSASGSRKRKHCKPKRLKIDLNSPENNGTNILSPVLSGHEHNKYSSNKGLCATDLVEGLQVLMLQDDDLLYPGTLTLVHPPDLYGVLLEGDRRRNRPIVLCQEEVFNKCIENKKISSDIAKSTRVAAYWSKTMNCLYKGHVSSNKSVKGCYDVSFDDGDLRVIPQEQIRYLPPGHFVSLDHDSDELIAFDHRNTEPLVLKSPRRKISTEKHKPIKLSKTITPKINHPTFENDRSFWKWSGPCYKCTENDKVNKTFYETLTRNNEIIHRGECAVFLSSGRPSLPYVGVIESMWESWGKTMVVRVRWFYHPEETIIGRKRHHGKNALYQSSHIDENDVQTISHVCTVISYKEYKRKRKPCDSNTYYCAGSYDPINGKIHEESD